MKLVLIALGLTLSVLPGRAFAIARGASARRIGLDKLLDVESAQPPAAPGYERAAKINDGSTEKKVGLVLGGAGLGTAIGGSILLASDGDKSALGGAMVGVGAVSTLVGGYLFYKGSKHAKIAEQRREDQPEPREALAAIDGKRAFDKIPKKVSLVSIKF